MLNVVVAVVDDAVVVAVVFGAAVAAAAVVGVVRQGHRKATTLSTVCGLRKGPCPELPKQIREMRPKDPGQNLSLAVETNKQNLAHQNSPQEHRP